MKNTETDIEFQDEDQKSKAAKPLESSYLYQGSDKQRGDPVLRVTVDYNVLYQTSDYSKHLSPSPLYTSFCPAISLLTLPP